ncbi:colicin uptake protein TolQ [Novipirellula galeiformis]|uniref:Colicin uptake protein TolQ n=2 Tax=Novipirellula galeiformis TaxID=2528004 RepID=A0A5C6CUT2_9BACT|nr:colicin uptake protein TolQ [Novipirellula galeiformis]
MALAVVVVMFVTLTLDALVVRSQDPSDIRIDTSEIQSVLNDSPAAAEASVDEPSPIDLLSLISRGGRFMIPIGLMSLLVVALAAERILTLRENKIIPRTLVMELRAISEPAENFNPNIAFHTCNDFPSPAATAIRAMLLRTGQPIGEIENAAKETIQREADGHAAPIRWLNLAAAATPLMGLLGTVWGMIVAFHESTTLTADRSRSEQLSEGIYTALVTTLAGLIVAIPAAMFAQYLENRLAKLFNQIEELAFELAPRMAPLVGRRRLDNQGTMHSMDRVKSNHEPARPPAPPVPQKMRSEAKPG